MRKERKPIKSRKPRKTRKTSKLRRSRRHRGGSNNVTTEDVHLSVNNTGNNPGRNNGNKGKGTFMNRVRKTARNMKKSASNYYTKEVEPAASTARQQLSKHMGNTREAADKHFGEMARGIKDRLKKVDIGKETQKFKEELSGTRKVLGNARNEFLKKTKPARNEAARLAGKGVTKGMSMARGVGQSAKNYLKRKNEQYGISKGMKNARKKTFKKMSSSAADTARFAGEAAQIFNPFSQS